MNQPGDKEMNEKLKDWVKQQLDATVKDFMEQGVVKGLLVEAKPAWAFPFQILIGKVREREQGDEFSWFICGDLPTDRLDSAQAASPREAARHFALKWQLEAERREPLDEELVRKAESLYELANEDSLWVTG